MDGSEEHLAPRSSGKPTEVLIVGAGPTGLMAAALLARSGVGVRIVDRSPGAAKESRAFAIQARTMELFLALGLADHFLDRGIIAAGAQVYVDGKHEAEFDLDDLGRHDTPFSFVLLVPQSEVEEILVAEIGRLGIEVERSTEVTGIEQGEGGVRAHARGPGGEGFAIEAAYLIGADGAHSIVRKELGLTFLGAPYPQTFLLADCKVDWSIDDTRFTMFLRGEHFALYFPLKGRDYCRIIVTDAPTAGDAPLGSQGSAPLDLSDVEAALRRAANLDLSLSEPRWTSRYRVHHRGVNSYGHGRAFVAGDAAHIHSPAAGQGMNTGLQDAANLCWKLALVLKHDAPPDLLGTYDRERRPVGEYVLKFTDRAFSFATTQNAWVSAIRDRLVPLFATTIARSGTVRSKAFRVLSQLGIRYEPGDFLVDGTSPERVRTWRQDLAPGRRAPDAAISRTVNVFDLIGGYRFHLLALSRRPLRAEEIDAVTRSLDGLREAAGLDFGIHLIAASLVGRDPRLLQAESGAVFEAYGLDRGTPQALYLVRPDGYIAWRTDSLDAASCGRFIADRFRRPSTS